MRVQVVALVFLFLVGCTSAPKPKTYFVVEPADPDIRLQQDDLFLKKAKVSHKKKDLSVVRRKL